MTCLDDGRQRLMQSAVRCQAGPDAAQVMSGTCSFPPVLWSGKRELGHCPSSQLDQGLLLSSARVQWQSDASAHRIAQPALIRRLRHAGGEHCADWAAVGQVAVDGRGAAV